jgi:hypothetical protein
MRLTGPGKCGRVCKPCFDCIILGTHAVVKLESSGLILYHRQRKAHAPENCCLQPRRKYADGYPALHDSER